MSYYLVDASAILCALVFLCLLHLLLKNNRRSLPLPPGPKGLPLIGNVLDMKDAEIWETGNMWGQIYGPLIHAESLGTSYIFINDYQTAVDLLEKRGSNYSSRPKNVMIELEGWSWLVPMMPYGDELRKSRQLLHSFFQPATVGDFAELQTQATHRMLERLMNTPDKYPELLRHSVGETFLRISYGYQALEEDDPYIMLAEKATEAISGAEGFFLVNVIPWLRYLPACLPGGGFQKIAKQAHKYSTDMYREPHKMAKAKFLDGMAVPSMSSKLIEANLAADEVIRNEALIAKVTGVTYVGGTDTTVSTLHSFLLAMLLYPDVQRHAQGELDRIVGKDILPSFADRPSLPYIEAIVKETFRWQPVGPFAVPHTAEENDEYNGYFIPSGATILPNVWAMLRDPKVYPEPDKFIPERWLRVEGQQPPLDVYKVVFGFGRRICPGRHFADNSVFIGIASILAAFNITKALDDNGMPITPKVEYVPHMIRYPRPFKYVLTPRSDKIETVIRQAVESVE